MAKYDVTFSCGCTTTLNLFGKSKDRYAKIEYLEGCECYTCQNKKVEIIAPVAPVEAKKEKIEYNKSHIMKGAHLLYKDTKGTKTFAECLKMSWAIAKIKANNEEKTALKLAAESFESFTGISVYKAA